MLRWLCTIFRCKPDCWSGFGGAFTTTEPDRRSGLHVLCIAVAAGIVLLVAAPALVCLVAEPGEGTEADTFSRKTPVGRTPIPSRPGSPVAECKAMGAEQDPAEQKRGLDALLNDWAAHDAPGASAFALTLGDETLRRECLLRVMQAWGTRDLAAALAWAEGAGFESAHEREIVMSMACTTAARRDPRAAVELGAAHGLDDFVNGVMGALIERWAEADLVAASSWMAAQEPGERRDALVASIALVVFETDPVEATRWVLDQTPAGEARDRVVFALMTRLAGQDPELARAWAEAFPAGPSREGALSQIERMRNWPRDDG